MRIGPVQPTVLFAIVIGLTVVPRPGRAQAQWTLIEELRIGAAETDATTFTDVRGVAIGTNGQIFVLEYRTQEIRAFDARGKFLKNIARRGGGPGEIATASGLVQAPDGTIWVTDRANSRFSAFRADGAFLRHHIIPINSEGFWGAVIDSKNRINDPIITSVTRSGVGLQAVRRVSLGDAKIDTVPFPCGNDGKVTTAWAGKNKNGGRFVRVPFSAGPVRLLDPRGFVWCAMGDKYRIVKTQLGRADTLAVIERTVPAVPVLLAEREAELARAAALMKGYQTINVDQSQVPTVKPVIVDLSLDDGGRLWVRRSTNEAMTTVFDVLDDRGAFVATVRAPFKIQQMWRPVVRGDAVYVTIVDEDDVEYVVRARIRK